MIDERPSNFPGATLPEQLRYFASRQPERLFVSHRARRLSWGETHERASALAAFLLDHGLAWGQRVGLMLERSPEAVLGFLGAVMAGGVAFPLDYNQPAVYLQYVLDFTSPAALLVQDKFLPQLMGLQLPCPPENIVVVGDCPDGPHPSWERLCAKGGADPQLALSPEEPAYLNFTSGTTGLPKGAITTHLNILANTQAAVAALDLRPDDVHLCMFPVVAHPHELFARALYLGGASALVEGIYPASLAATIRDNQVSAMMAVAAIYETLVRSGDVKGSDLASLRAPESGGMHVNAELARRFQERFNARLTPVWGSTETTGIALAFPLHEQFRPGSMGKPCPGYEIKAIGEDGQEVGPGQLGDMWVRGPGVITGYFANEQETAKTLRDGWFMSGDLVKIDQDGFFHFQDRKARMLKVGGLKVFCTEVEETLASHPAVLEATVVRAFDPSHGEMPRAYVVLQPGQEAKPRDLRRYLEERLARYKVPKQYEFIEALPRSSAGKVLWRTLQDSGGEPPRA